VARNIVAQLEGTPKTAFAFSTIGLRVALDWTLDILFAKDLVQFRTHRAPTISRRETMTFMRDDHHVERTQRSDEVGTIPTAMSL